MAGAVIQTKRGTGAPADLTLQHGELAVDPDAGALYVGDAAQATVKLTGDGAAGSYWTAVNASDIKNANTGNVGLGVIGVPTSLLHLREDGTTPSITLSRDSDAPGMQLTAPNGGTGTAVLRSYADGLRLRADSADSFIRLDTVGTQRMYINNAGNAIIGPGSVPAGGDRKLTIQGNSGSGGDARMAIVDLGQPAASGNALIELYGNDGLRTGIMGASAGNLILNNLDATKRVDLLCNSSLRVSAQTQGTFINTDNFGTFNSAALHVGGALNVQSSLRIFDNNFFLAGPGLITDTPIINFEGNAYMGYNRTSNFYRFIAASSELCRMSSTGVDTRGGATGTTGTGGSNIYLAGGIQIVNPNFNPRVLNMNSVANNPATIVAFNRDGVLRGGINCPNAAGTPTFYGNSDAVLKTNIVDYSPTTALSVMAAVQPREFDVIEDNSHQIGFIAQEIEAIPELAHLVFQPEVTTWDEDGVQQTDISPTKVVSELRSFDAFLVASIKELLSRVETLENP